MTLLEDFYKKIYPEYANSMHPWHVRFMDDFNDYKDIKNNKFIIVGLPACAKTTLASVIVVWISLRLPKSQIVVISSSKEQASYSLWANIKDVCYRLGKGKVTETKANFSNGSEIILMAYNKAVETSLRGLHPKDENSLVGIVADEAISFTKQTFHNIAGIHASGKSFELLLSNGWQYETKGYLSQIWHLENCPYKKYFISNKPEDINITTKSEEYVKNIENIYGKEYIPQVSELSIGLTSGFVGRTEIDRMHRNYINEIKDYTIHRAVMGVDCRSSITNGKHSIAIRDGIWLLHLDSYTLSIQELADKINLLKKRYKIRYVNIDACGVGREIIPLLRKDVRDINPIITSHRVTTGRVGRLYESYRTALIQSLINWALHKHTKARFTVPQSAILTALEITLDDKILRATPKRELQKIVKGYALDEIDALLYTFAKGSNNKKFL